MAMHDDVKNIDRAYQTFMYNVAFPLNDDFLKTKVHSTNFEYA